jgi:hypothetical protein
MSWYLTIRADALYSRFVAAEPLVGFLAALPELRQTGPTAFESAAGFPWVSLTLAKCGPDGNYASDGRPLPRVNVLELACSDSGDAGWYESLAGRIASFLEWEAVEEHEDRRVWPPAEATPAEPPLHPTGPASRPSDRADSPRRAGG